METPIQVEDHIPYLWVRVASQCEGQVSQSPMAMRPNKVGVDKGNGRNHIERYTHTHLYSAYAYVVVWVGGLEVWEITVYNIFYLNSKYVHNQ